MADSVLQALIVAGTKVPPGHLNGRKKGIHDYYDLSAAIANNAEIDSLYIPEGAIILDAWIKSPTMGATGIFQLGCRAFEDSAEASVAEDPDGLVALADAGGQAVFQRAATEALIGTKVGKGGAQLFLKCIEITVATSGRVQWHVEFLLP